MVAAGENPATHTPTTDPPVNPGGGAGGVFAACPGVAVADAIIFINGLGQRVNPLDGLFGAYLHAYTIWAHRLAALIMHLTERADMRDAAAYILGHHPARVHVVPFSYGAGRGLTRLAAELEKLGRSIHSALLIDPVAYRRINPTALGWLGRNLEYKVPPNVGHVWTWRQVNHRSPFQPVGHRAVATSPTTIIHPEVVLGDHENLKLYAPQTPPQRRRYHPTITHSTIDQDATVRDEVIAQLLQIIPTPPPESSAAA